MGLDFPGIVGFFPWGTEPIVFPGLLKASHCMCQWILPQPLGKKKFIFCAFYK